MRKIVDGTLIVMCILTLVSADYAQLEVIDWLLFACMGVALVSLAALAVTSFRKGK